MSLQFWFSFNGNLNNQGLENANLTLTNSTNYVDANFGKALSFMNDFYITTDYAWNPTVFSISAWIYTINTPSGTIVRNHTKYSPVLDFSGGYLRYFIWKDSNSNVLKNYSQYPKNEWFNVIFTYDGNTAKLFINGELKDSFNYSGSLYNTGNLQIGYCQALNSRLNNVYLKDLRIYNHTLSLSEIKEINNNLFLHLPMNNLERTYNIAKETNQDITNWNWSLQKGNIIKTEEIIDGIKCCKLERGTTEASGWNYISYSNIQPNYYKSATKYTISCEIYPSINNIIGFSFRNANSINVMTNTIYTNIIANQWNKINITLTTIDSFDNITIGDQRLYISGFDTVIGNYIIFRNLKIEEGEVATPWNPNWEDTNFWYNNIETDVSGFNNNLMTIIEISPISLGKYPIPKYNKCYFFNGTNRIYGNLSIDNIWSYSIWICPTKLDSPNFILCLNANTLTTNIQLGCYINSTYIRFYANGKEITKNYNFSLNTWYHIASTFNGTNLKLYINSNLESIQTITNTLTKRNNFNIGCRNNSEDNNQGAYFFNGYMSDLRMYAKELKEEDIFNLYNSGI